MKKHPIDELFAKNLVEFRQEPSQRAFEKFQARLQEKQEKPKGGIFFLNRNWSYYAAAAGIILALTVGILSQRNTTKESVLASSEILPKVASKAASNAKSTDSQSVMAKNSTNNAVENTVSKSDKVLLKATKTTIIANETSVAKVEIQPKVIENTIIDDSPEEQTSVAINAIFENTAAEKIEPAEVKSTEIFKNPIDESIVLILEPEQIEKEVIPAINQDSETNLADARRLGQEKEEESKSFIAKLYGEYKHFKYGEKVDLKKIGVKDALARVDEGLFKEEREDVIGFLQRRVGRLKKENN